MAISYETAQHLLSVHGQGHLLRFWERLDEAQRRSLLSQIEALDFETLAQMQAALQLRSRTVAYDDIEPAPVLSLTAEERADMRRVGEEVLRSGEVGVVLVAGGQGSRLGFEGPKGAFPIGPITNAPLFAVHARKLLALKTRYGFQLPFYIMTSEANDAQTREFFEEHAYFGLVPEGVHFFVQGMWPALFEDGRIVLERPDRIFFSPDGHGGVLAALRASGMLADMEKRGLRMIFYFQVDNPLVEIAEPVCLGVHQTRQADITVKVCAKRDPEEGLGVVAVRGARTLIVEYTELSREQKHARLPNGDLKFRFGSVAIHVFSLSFLQREAGVRLPLHLAHKKVPYCDDEGRIIRPDKPNAYKFEKFIFDVLPDAERVVNLEFRREDEFSPVKNATGHDSPDTARRDLMRKYARWLTECGITVPRGANGELIYRVEIDPAFAADVETFREKLPPDLKITGDLLLA